MFSELNKNFKSAQLHTYTCDVKNHVVMFVNIFHNLYLEVYDFKSFSTYSLSFCHL